VSLEQVGAHVYLSPNYISQIFKKSTGTSFHEYLLAVKMKRARELLIDLSNRIMDVSALIGYSDQNNFARAFRQYYGCSPRHFRRDLVEKGLFADDENH
jgi:AraC-like DNA-binding protein